MGQPITLGGTDGATLNLGNNDGYYFYRFSVIRLS